MMALPAAEQTRHGQLMSAVFPCDRCLLLSFKRAMSFPTSLSQSLRLFLPSDRLPNERQRIIAVRGKFFFD
jgi:hypothetical protein